jgi:hypothetical protein
MLSVVIRSIISAGRAQDSVSIWSSGHATSAGPENALSTEERMGSHGLLHIIQGWIFVFFFFNKFKFTCCATLLNVFFGNAKMFEHILEKVY